jgi:hypothetical protein
MTTVRDGEEEWSVEDVAAEGEEFFNVLTYLDIEDRHQIVVDLAGSIDIAESGIGPTRWRLLDAVRKMIREANDLEPAQLAIVHGHDRDRVEEWTVDAAAAEAAVLLGYLMGVDAVDRHQIVKDLAASVVREEHREVERWNVRKASKRTSLLARLFQR